MRDNLQEEVFVGQPPGYEKKGLEKKVLYGLKQAPKAWYSRIDAHFAKLGFERCPFQHALYVKSNGGKMLIVYLYVDEFIFTDNNVEK